MLVRELTMASVNAIEADQANPLRHPRRGAIAPLTGILAVFILGMVAFSIDSGWIVLTQSELQNAADSAALAGANKLMDPMVIYYSPNQSASEKATILTNAMSDAKTTAINYASYNGAGGVNSLALKDADIEFGFTNSSNIYSKYDSSNPVFPNTVKVLLRRDPTANGSLNLFFAPAIGTKSRDLTATASATLYSGKISDLKTDSSPGILPVTFDVNKWNEFMSTGKDPYGDTVVDANGNPLLTIYNRFKDTGNFGWLSLDDSHASAEELRDWIDNGPTTSEVTTLKNNNLIPFDTLDLWDWRGTTGFKSSCVMAANEYVGKSFLLPLFKPFSQGTKVGNNIVGYEPGVGNGSNYDYNIVQFVSVMIMVAEDDNRDIIIRPAAYIDPNAIFSNLQPAGSPGNTQVTTFAPPKLTR